jgi:hypothetical protein
MKKSQLRESIRKMIKEEGEYAQFFAKALEKAGKKITDMSDDEKKAFFDKIDAAWKGKDEKPEPGDVVTEAVEDDIYKALTMHVKGFNKLGADEQGELVLKIQKLLKSVGIR